MNVSAKASKLNYVLSSIVLLLLILVSLYFVGISEYKSLLGMPFIITYFLFKGLAKVQLGALGKRLANKHIGYELLIIGGFLTVIGILMQYSV